MKDKAKYVTVEGIRMLHSRNQWIAEQVEHEQQRSGHNLRCPDSIPKRAWPRIVQLRQDHRGPTPSTIYRITW